MGTRQKTYDHARKSKYVAESKERMYYLEIEVIREINKEQRERHRSQGQTEKR